ncbi:uncharacterized protein OCT59_022585 [Rhizophagus irregularis]|uniref:Uncharacterized protein n=3 Tax=Rhizophagus irregularis TaxID=588596 RepID=A0A916E998_9GLOM|nr:hypothetical protein OCT59_022585 [Rhizophagus irregularis]CAB5372603.1 unnamed protein product [Rhizophagus irregularis]
MNVKMNTILEYLKPLINNHFKYPPSTYDNKDHKADLIFSNGIIITINIPSLNKMQSLLNRYSINDEKPKKIEGAFNLYFELIKDEVLNHYPELDIDLACTAAKTWRDADVHFREEFEKLDFQLELI